MRVDTMPFKNHYNSNHNGANSMETPGAKETPPNYLRRRLAALGGVLAVSAAIGAFVDNTAQNSADYNLITSLEHPIGQVENKIVKGKFKDAKRTVQVTVHNSQFAFNEAERLAKDGSDIIQLSDIISAQESDLPQAGDALVLPKDMVDSQVVARDNATPYVGEQIQAQPIMTVGNSHLGQGGETHPPGPVSGPNNGTPKNEVPGIPPPPSIN